ncbi:MAG: YebC/PmpR family DNA-binding transcriptional regulator [bacterium]|nr:YebC/PmpR family DNA-binding transcriptional regulator [bacterium]
MFQRSSRLVIVSMALTLIVAACGGGDDETAGDNDGGDGTTGSTAATVVPTALPNIPGLSDECRALANMMLAATQAFTGINENVDEMFAAAEAGVPDDLRDDVAIVKKAVESFGAALEELGVNPFQDPTAFANLTEEQIEQLEAASDLLDGEDVNNAFDEISDWGERECDEFAPGG